MDEKKEDLAHYFERRIQIYAKREDERFQKAITKINKRHKNENSFSIFAEKIKCLLGHMPDDVTLNVLYTYLDGIDVCPEWVIEQEELKKSQYLHDQITKILPLLNDLMGVDSTAAFLQKGEKFLDADAGEEELALYAHMALAGLLPHLRNLITKDKKRGKKSREVEIITRRVILGFVYYELVQSYKNEEMGIREKEGFLRKEASKILSTLNVYVPGMSLKTKGDKDRFQIELREGLLLKDKEYKFYSDLLSRNK